MIEWAQECRIYFMPCIHSGRSSRYLIVPARRPVDHDPGSRPSLARAFMHAWHIHVHFALENISMPPLFPSSLPSSGLQVSRGRPSCNSFCNHHETPPPSIPNAISFLSIQNCRQGEKQKRTCVSRCLAVGLRLVVVDVGDSILARNRTFWYSRVFTYDFPLAVGVFSMVSCKNIERAWLVA